MKDYKGWKGVDFDGTLAVYNKWVSPESAGEPVPLMLARVKAWLANGEDVRIFTARVHPDNPGADISRLTIDKWCMKHLGRRLPITCSKDYACAAIYDDRAVQIIPNTGLRADGIDDTPGS